MESASIALVLLVQLSALLGTTSLSVKQGPTSLWVEQGSQVTFTCQVAYAQAWELLRIGWTKDGQVLCQTHVTNNSLSLGVCGPRGWLVWQSPGNLTLRLDQVSANDSGDYVCWAAVEIPELEESEGNGTHLLVAPDDPQGTPASSFPGLLSSLLMAGVVVVAAIALGAGIWGRRRRLHRDSVRAQVTEDSPHLLATPAPSWRGRELQPFDLREWIPIGLCTSPWKVVG
nr:transmembrane and immunoglobulin domain-containing protein 2 [Loxodonta africana]